MRTMLVILTLCGFGLGQQVYTNAALNARYTAPAGWVFDPPDTVYGKVSIKPNRVGLNPIFIDVGFEKATTTLEAYLSIQAYNFAMMKVFWGAFNATTQAPVLTYIRDTVISKVHLSYSVLKQVDQNRVQVIYAASNQTYTQFFHYMTTITEENANSDIYGANWDGMEFINVNGPATKVGAEKRITSQAETKALMRDVMGRWRKEARATPTFKAMPAARR